MVSFTCLACGGISQSSDPRHIVCGDCFSFIRAGGALTLTDSEAAGENLEWALARASQLPSLGDFQEEVDYCRGQARSALDGGKLLWALAYARRIELLVINHMVLQALEITYGQISASIQREFAEKMTAARSIAFTGDLRGSHQMIVNLRLLISRTARERRAQRTDPTVRALSGRLNGKPKPHGGRDAGAVARERNAAVAAKILHPEAA